MVQWFDKSSASAGSYKDSVRSIAKSFIRSNSPERSPVPVRSTRRSGYGSDKSSNSYNTSYTSDDFPKRVTSPAYSQSTNFSDGSSDYGYSSRPSTPVMSYSTRNSRANTPVLSYSTRNSRAGTPVRNDTSKNHRISSPVRKYSTASSRCDTPIRYYENSSSRQTTPIRSFCTPSSRATTPLGSYVTPNSRSGTPLRSTNGYVSRDSSPTPTIPAPNEAILNPIRNRPTSTNSGDLPLPKSRADIKVPLKYYFIDIPNDFKPSTSTTQRGRSSSRSRSICKEDESSTTNNVTLRQRSSSANRSSCYGEIQQSRPRDLPLPRPRSVYSLAERDSNTLPRQSRKSYIETDLRASSVGRDMYGSSESLQNLIQLPSTKDIETRVRATMRAKLSLPTISSDNARSRKARSQYLSGVPNGNHYRDENGAYNL